MRLLLDTHALLWFVLNDGKLSRAVDSIISDSTNEVFVSPATFWELAIKVRTKKLELKFEQRNSTCCRPMTSSFEME